jgi:hypothetical protein
MEVSDWLFIYIWFSIPAVTIIILILIDLFIYGLKRLSYYNSYERISACIHIIVFGPPGSIALIRAFIDIKRKEREEIKKTARWWELREYGGWK